MYVTYRTSKFSNDLQNKTLQDIYQIIKTENAELTARIRACEKKEDRNELKKQLPTFNAGVFKDRVCNDNFISSKYLCYDIDKISNPEDIKSLIVKNKDIKLCFVSPSGRGVKFFVELDKDIDNLDKYKEVYLYYFNLFENFYGFKLNATNKDSGFDSGDKTPSLGAYLGYDSNAYFNEHNSLLSANVCNDEVSETNDDEILTHCSEVLKGKITSYSEWLSVGFSLSNLKENGFKYFRILSDETITDRKLQSKFNNLIKSNKGNIPLSHFIRLAVRFGATVKDTYQHLGGVIECPFKEKESGLWNVEGEKSYLVASFKKVKYLYDLVENGKRIKVLDIDCEEVRLTAENLSHHTSMRVAMANTKAGRWFGTLKDLDKFVRFIDKISTGKEVITYDDLGKINDNLWNLGNVALVGNVVKQNDEIIWIGNSGYKLKKHEDMFINLSIRSEMFMEQIHAFYNIYKERSLFMLGFAVSTLFFDNICDQYSSFPHLYLFGASGTGKSKTIDIILSMFGFNNRSRQYQSLSAKSTSNAVQRISAETCNLPIVLDEYTDLTGKELVKSRYDYKSKFRADKSNDNSVNQSKVGGSTIVSTRHLTTEQEIATRCIFVEFNNDNKVDLKEFMKLYNRRLSLSLFITFILSFINKDSIMKNIDYWVDKLNNDERFDNIDTRILINYAIFLGGFECIKHLFKESINYNSTTDMVYNQISTTQSISNENSQAKIFCDHLETCLEDLIKSGSVIEITEVTPLKVTNEYNDDLEFKEGYFAKFNQVYKRVIKENNVSTKMTIGSSIDLLKQLQDAGVVVEAFKKNVRYGSSSFYNPVIISKNFIVCSQAENKQAEDLPF